MNTKTPAILPIDLYQLFIRGDSPPPITPDAILDEMTTLYLIGTLPTATIADGQATMGYRWINETAHELYKNLGELLEIERKTLDTKPSS